MAKQARILVRLEDKDKKELDDADQSLDGHFCYGFEYASARNAIKNGKNPSYTDLQKLLASTQVHGERSVREQAPAH